MGLGLFFLNIGRWFLSKLNLKTFGLLIVLALLAYGGYKLYEGIYQRGVASQAALIKDLQTKLAKANTDLTAARGERDQAKADLKTAKDNYAQWQRESNEREDKLKKAQALVKADLTKQLAAAKARVAALQKVKDDLPKYVSPASDAACTLPVGFVFLYNQSLQAGGQHYLLARPDAGNAGLPSGIPLSRLASVSFDNNVAAVQNRELVLAWQQWWRNNKALWEKYHASAPPQPFVQAPKGK